MAEPLQRLIPDKAEFPSGAQQQAAFVSVKDALVNATEVAHPRLGEHFLLNCDASAAGLDTALAEKDGRGAERLIAFARRVLRANEREMEHNGDQGFRCGLGSRDL